MSAKRRRASVSGAEIDRLEAYLRLQLQALRAHDEGTRRGVDPEDLHQLRVACRRARTALRAARRLVANDWAADLERPLRRLGQVSGPARDLDVLGERLRQEAEGLGATDAAAVARLLEQLEQDRAALQGELAALLDSDDYRALLAQLEGPVVVAPQPSARTLAALAARELARLLAQVRQLGPDPSDEQLHALRIRVKRVRYAAELGGLPRGVRVQRVNAAATALQDLLGEHRDAIVAEERLRELAVRLGDPAVALVAGRLVEREQRRVDDLAQRLPAAWRRLRRLACELG